jgi:putative peptidoglycan lipid II flippase
LVKDLLKEKKNNMTGNAMMIMVSVVLSRILGFVRTMLIPERLGGMNEVTDAYNLAFLLPDLMYSLLVGGAISAALIPMLASYIEKKDEEDGWKAVSTFVNATFIAMFVVSVLGIVFAPQLMNIIAPGYDKSNTEVYELSVQLTRILFPSVCFLMLAGLCNGIMNSYQKFVVAAYGPCLYNLLCIFSIYFLSSDDPSNHYSVHRVVWGVVLSSFIYFLFQIAFTFKHLKHYRFGLYFRHKGFKQMLKLAIPSLLTTSVMQVNIIISNSVTTNFPEGSVTALNIASKTWQMPLGIIAQSMGVAMLPVLSTLFAAEKKDEFIQKFNKALRTVLMLAIPSAFAEQNIGRLMHGVRIHTGINAFESGCGDFLLHGGVSVQFRHGHQRQERKQQLVELRYVAVGKNTYIVGFRINPGGYIVNGQLLNVFGNMFECVSVG